MALLFGDLEPSNVRDDVALLAFRVSTARI